MMKVTSEQKISSELTFPKRFPRFISLLALAGIAGCEMKTPNERRNPNGDLYVDKGNGVFFINQLALNNDYALISQAFSDWRKAHPNLVIENIVEIGPKGSTGGLVLLTREAEPQKVVQQTHTPSEK